MQGFQQFRQPANGFSLLDVIIAIAVFAIGVLAFSQYQTSLVRSNMDARLRTMASNIAEETIESQRRFVRLDSDPDGVQFAYADITSGNSNLTLGGVGFIVNRTVTPYYWNKASQEFTSTAVAGRPHSDFKLMEVTVSWQNPLGFRIGDPDGANSRLNSGSASISSIISSNVTAAGRLALIDDLSGNPLHLPLSALPPALPEIDPPIILTDDGIPSITIPLLPRRLFD